MPRIHLIVRGRVQGVFYRTTAVERARDLGLTGWVRNLHDGGVELCAEGAADGLAILRSWCAHGPAGAGVRDVEEFKEAATGEFVEFDLRSDG
jgi:acylphosphatase